MPNMRRKDRELPREIALSIVDKCAYSVMATVNPDGSPYCIPLSLAMKGEWLYFHCAKEGHKIDNLRHNCRVCISCVGEVKPIREDFSTEFESAVISGTASEILDPDEKIYALRLISERYTPDNMQAFDEAIRKSIENTGVWKIHMDEISGKQKKLDKDGREIKYGRT